MSKQQFVYVSSLVWSMFAETQQNKNEEKERERKQKMSNINKTISPFLWSYDELKIEHKDRTSWENR